MGRGIAAAIPIMFSSYDRFSLNKEHFVPFFFDNYDPIETDKAKRFVIKEDLLIKNYKSFVKEFYELIGENLFSGTELTYDDMPDVSSLNQFTEVFSHEDLDYTMPKAYNQPLAFDMLGGRCEKYWLFYNGSYKAYLEVFSTFLHFESILAKTMDNPLATAIKFGIFG